MKHGRIYELEDGSECRWCEKCNRYHGKLFPCKHYSILLLKKIKREGLILNKNLRNPAWIKKQAKKEFGQIVIGVLQFFSEDGLEDINRIIKSKKKFQQVKQY